MVRSILRPISKSGHFVSNLMASATGSFLFTRGFRLIALNGEEPRSAVSMSGKDGDPKPVAGIGAALLLVAFISSEAVATVLALRR